MLSSIPANVSRGWEEQPNPYMWEMREKQKGEWSTAEYSDGGSCGTVKYPRLRINHNNLTYLFSQASKLRTDICVLNPETRQMLLGSMVFEKDRIFNTKSGQLFISTNRDFAEIDLEKILKFITPKNCDIKPQ